MPPRKPQPLALENLRQAARAVVEVFRDKSSTRKQRTAALDHLAHVIDRKQGRPGVLPEVVDKVLALRAAGKSMAAIAKELGVSTGFVSKTINSEVGQ